MESPFERPSARRRPTWLSIVTAAMMSGQFVILPTGLHDLMSLRPPETSVEHKCHKNKKATAAVKADRTAETSEKAAPKSGWAVLTRWFL